MENCKYNDSNDLNNPNNLNNLNNPNNLDYINSSRVILKDTSNGLEFIKLKKNNYSTIFSICNNNILLPKIINFDIVDLIYKLNPDIYEFIKLNKINDNEAELIAVTKHFFKDLGLPQRFAHLKIIKIIKDDSIEFQSTSIINDKKPPNVPENAQQLPIVLIKSVCNIINPHEISIIQNIQLNDKSIPVPPYIEKMFGSIIKKIFTRVKQFIENITL